jgi:nucleotide-binding universal stress UspA family protein
VYRRILAALDGSKVAERVLPHVESLGEQYGAAVTLLRAVTSSVAILNAEAVALAAPIPPPVVDPEPIVAAEREEAQSYLEALAERLRGHGLAVDVVLPEGDAAEAIVEQAGQRSADLIAMTTHGHGGLGRVLMGSVADAVVRRAPCPVLLVRVHDEAD